ncbi:MAG: sigma-70 family RNA polymerase sigma factor [Polyangiaceae bacterium]|nr:sigma-70 family RNA polymerase sigma factor [Polyangiaceae bacterium]
MYTALAAEILAERPEGPPGPTAAELADRLVAMIERALARHPGFGVEPAEFGRYLAEKLAATPVDEPIPDELSAEDLLLALACARGEAAALAAFEEAYRPELAAALAKLRVAADWHADLRQRLWQKLFVGDGGRPRILEFSGRGLLKHWFRVTVVRSLLDELRRDKRRPAAAAEDAILGVPEPGPDPEMDHMKRLYRHEFRLAFEEAVVALSPDDRNMLRCHFAQQMTIDEIGAAFGIHRATAARRVNRAREHLIAGTRERLAARLSLSEPEMQSVLRLIESNLHVSVARLLD